MTYKFSEHSGRIINQNKVVLGNRQTGQWMRISKEVYDILNLGIDNNLSISELKMSLYDEEDKNYISQIYLKLCNIGIIEDENNKQVLPNKLAVFEMTHRCNLKCIHCCIDADDLVSDNQDLSTEETKCVLYKIIEWNPKRILLSGGEPMIRKDFKYLLKYLRNNYHGTIIVSTNGTLINSDNVDNLVECSDEISISVDGINEETCSIVRGHGVFDKVINSVKLLQSRGFKRITLSMTTGDKNEYLEDDFNELNRLLGTKPCIRGFAPIGRGEKNRSYFSSYEKNEIHVPNKFISDNYNNPMVMLSCGGGNREIFIAHNGDIYPCPSFLRPKYLMGNILKLDKLSNWNKEVYKLLKEIDPNNYKICKGCKVNLFCWTCLAQLDSVRDNGKAIENKCKKVKPVLFKRIWGSVN
ncbi:MULTISPECIES: radical SAM/SPASM domain-containing protein [Tissierellales]|jgi:radical SAM protein with 4Fe4S-binding SPASM domain|nr:MULTISPECIES: radical SAM protein [Tissierellales]SCL88456.1 Antilisterial bacteriocin subtilosin biosynthesis protein AlbA [Sporanaerobacter sp. PP17-6a]